MTVAPDGANPRTYYQADGDLVPQAWSPDGRYLLFSSGTYAPGETSLLLVELASGTVTSLATGLTYGDADWAPLPAWGELSAQTVGVPAGEPAWLYISRDYALTLFAPQAGSSISLTPPYMAARFWASPQGEWLMTDTALFEIQIGPDGLPQAAARPMPELGPVAEFAWAPDGGRFALRRKDGSAWVGEPGGVLEPLPEAAGMPAWSADSRWLAYKGTQDSLWIKAVGGPATRIAEGLIWEQPIWSPAAPLLAYATGEISPSDERQTWVYDPQTGQSNALAQPGAPLSWSPDGRLLAQEWIEILGASAYTSQVFAVDPFTGRSLLLGGFYTRGFGYPPRWRQSGEAYLLGPYRFSSDLASAILLHEDMLDATTDGSRLMYVQLSGETSTDAEVFLFDVPTGQRRLIRQIDLGTIYGAVMPGIWGWFSADGRWAVISAFEHERSVAWLIRLEDGAQFDLPSQNLIFDDPFTPDGRWLNYIENRWEETGKALYLRDLTGGSVNILPVGVEAFIRLDTPQAVPSTPTAAPFTPTQPPVAPTELAAVGASPTSPAETGAKVPGPPLSSWLQTNALRLAALGGCAGLGLLLVLGAALLLVFRRGRGVSPVGEKKTSIPAASPSMRPARAPAPSQQREPQGASTPVPEQGSEAAVQALLQASISQVQTGRIEAGLAGLRQVTERAPRQAEAWLWMGRAYEQAGDLQTAGRCYLRAARLGHSQAEQALARLQGRGRSST